MAVRLNRRPVVDPRHDIDDLCQVEGADPGRSRRLARLGFDVARCRLVQEKRDDCLGIEDHLAEGRDRTNDDGDHGDYGRIEVEYGSTTGIDSRAAAATADSSSRFMSSGTSTAVPSPNQTRDRRKTATGNSNSGLKIVCA